MNRRSLIIIAALVVMGAAALLLIRWYANSEARLPATTDKDLAAAAAKLGAREPFAPPAFQAIAASHRLRLAIGSLGLGDEAQNQNVAALVLAELHEAPGLEMVERQALSKVLSELQLTLSGLVRAKDAVRAGKLLRADWFLLGTPAVVNRTNVAVLRIVDARTGIMRDATMIARNADPAQAASEITAFIQRSRQEASAPKPKIYLAVGSFEDLSVNNRQATLPGELRAYLTAAYQKGGVTMLEREFVSTLLNEIYLDLAGLTAEDNTNLPPMQSAYWLVDGYYQTYETTRFEVELGLQVHRMFGKTQRFNLREKPGEPLFHRVKERIDAAMTHDQAALVVTRLTELRSQLSFGGQLLRSVNEAMTAHAFSTWLDYTGNMSATEVQRHRRNIQEAIRAFQSALLLDPTNRQAKAALAECFSTPFAGRFDEARDLYRELIDVPVQDEIADSAKAALEWSFARFVSPAETHRWFESAANTAINTPAMEFFKTQAKAAAEGVTLQKVGTPEAEKVAEEQLFRRINSWAQEVKNHAFTIDFDNTGLGAFARAFGTNQAGAAGRMVELLPKLQAVATNLAPHIFAGVVTFQVETNAPIIAEFERSLEAFSEKPPPYPELRYYIELLASPVYRWAERHALYRLAARLKEVYVLSASQMNDLSVNDDDRLGLGFDFLRAEEWQKALDVFQSFSNRPVLVGNSGGWGPAFSVVLPGKEAALCREKLGLPALTDPREFDLGKPCLHPDSRSVITFKVVADGLWLGLADEVMHLDFDLRTNFLATLQTANGAPITALCVGTSNLWLGTSGSGLVELDKATHQTRRFTEKDGLLMDYVSSLHLRGETLWIGYGNEAKGGLGRFDLKTGQFTSFAASLWGKPDAAQPPARRVTAIETLPSGEVWCMAGSTLFRCRPAENTWAPEPARNNVWTTCYAVDSDCLIEALRLAQVELTVEPDSRRKTSTNGASRLTRVMTCEESTVFEHSLTTNGSGLRVSGSKIGVFPDAGELELLNLSDGRKQRLFHKNKLPGPPTTLTLQGREAWIGGLGFVALVDLDDNAIKRIAYLPARSIEQIQLASGWLWVQSDRHIYRTSLQAFH